MHKSVGIAAIVAAIRTLAAGEPLLAPRETIALLRLAGQRRSSDEEAQRALARLTRREREVLQVLTDGLSDRDIAARLGISHETARTHMVNLLAKLGVESRLQAVLFAIRHGAVTLT